MSRYYADRIATVTSGEPARPALPWPIGQRFTLAEDEGPWAHIEVCGYFDNGADYGGYEPVVRPVEIVPEHDCAPRKVSPNAIVALGYIEIDTPEPQPEAWETPDTKAKDAMPADIDNALAKLEGRA